MLRKSIKFVPSGNIYEQFWVIFFVLIFYVYNVEDSFFEPVFLIFGE